MGQPKFEIGDKVVVVKADSFFGDYVNGDVGHVCQISHELHGYVTRIDDGRRINVYWEELELFKEPEEHKPNTEVISIAWKIDGVHFTNEGNGNISIFGNGEITISIEHLKTILDTVQGT
jgi:hypothetical protein